MENPADKDKFPAPSHFLFSCFGWGSLQGRVMQLTLSWLHVPAEGRKKESRILVAKTICNLVTSYWHLCRGDAKDDREGIAVPIYLLL